MAAGAVSLLPRPRSIAAPPKRKRARIAHIRLGDTNVALCGSKIRGEPASSGADKCVVCLELAQLDRFYTR